MTDNDDPLAGLAEAARAEGPVNRGAVLQAAALPRARAVRCLLWPVLGWAIVLLWWALPTVPARLGCVFLLMPFAAMGLWSVGMVASFTFLLKARPFRRRGYKIRGMPLAYMGFALSAWPVFVHIGLRIYRALTLVG